MDVPSKESLLSARRRLVAPSLSLSYREPLRIVRGEGAYLFDDTGRDYLDCVNNVAHVGHSHPRVAEAAGRQLSLLNTNTRYLYDGLTAYAERLTALLPDSLSVCFFVNSGSEANDLALRLARTATGRRDVIVIDQAYHGHTTALVEISPYKFDGPGGAGRPPHTQVVSTPDRYRGRYREPESAGRYAALVEEAVGRAVEHSGGVAAFFAESILSCAGQIVLPPGYLAEAFATVRKAGGLCVSDEVQVGFGRVGSSMWAFESQEVVPDIVTMGKPIGNGFPLGAVVTTPEIAAAFANGMEYFNTYGGNPVACAVGLAVLSVIEEEGLQHRALETGEALMAGFRSLASTHALIGDVRGMGLFIGIELVTDRETRDPSGAEAAELINRAKELGVLLSTDGPDHNVLKIKPPMVFGTAEVTRLLEAVDAALQGLD